MKHSRLLLPLFCLAAFIAVTTTAHADTFAFGGFFENFGNVSGSLTAIADPGLPGAFDITGISGSLGSLAITGLLPCSSHDPNHPCSSGGSSFLYDNLLYSVNGIQRLDVGFTVGTGTLEAAIVPFGTHTYQLVFNIPQDHLIPGGVSASPVPEPSSLILLGTGLLGIVGTFRRRLLS